MILRHNRAWNWIEIFCEWNLKKFGWAGRHLPSWKPQSDLIIHLNSICSIPMGELFLCYERVMLGIAYICRKLLSQAKFFGIIFEPRVNSHAGGMAVARPIGFEIDSMRNTISGSAAWFFVYILKFIFPSIFEIKIHEKNPCHQKSAGPAGQGKLRKTSIRLWRWGESEIENSGFLIFGETHQYGTFGVKSGTLVHLPSHLSIYLRASR